MLTPAFEISQDDIFIHILIKAPYARVSDAEIFIEDDEFRFHSKPYFLRLSLPGRIIEDGREEAKYKADDGSFTVKVPKETEGQVFEGLDMLTQLLTPKGQTNATGPLIEVLSETTNEDQDDNDEVHEEEFDWHIQQVPYQEDKLMTGSQRYGFDHQKSGMFTRLQDEVVEIVDLKDPDHVGLKERREKRQETENNKFDKDHYIADLYDDDVIQGLISYNPELSESLTDEDKELMRNLPKKQYLIENKISVYFGLVDIIFAFCYDQRSTEGEQNVESAWTISKLSSTLSWLDMFSSLEETLVACYRRCLSYPLYRHWSLVTKVQQDVANIFLNGKQGILHCLLTIHRCFSGSYPHYLLNDLYITDYCVWIQFADEKQLQSLADAIKKCKIDKSDVGLDLVPIEKLTEEDIMVDEMENLASNIKNVNIQGSNTGSDDESTDRSGECTDSDDESTDTGDENTDTNTSGKYSDDNKSRSMENTNSDEVPSEDKTIP